MARAFQAPDIPEEPKAQARAVSEAFIVIANELAELRSRLAAPPKTRALDTSGTTIMPAVGDTLRLKPPAAGTKVTLPASNAANKGGRVKIIVEGTAGNVVVSAIDGLVQLGASVTLSGLGEREFESDGGDGGAVGGWWLLGGFASAVTFLDTDLIDVDTSNPGFVRWLHVNFPQGSFLAQNLTVGTAQPRHVLLADFAGTGMTYDASVNNRTAPFPNVQQEYTRLFPTAATSVDVDLPTAFHVVTNPTGRKTGDRIQILAHLSTNIANTALVAPAGWTAIINTFSGTSSTMVIERVLDGTETSPLTISSGGGAGAAAWETHLWLVRDGHPTLASRATFTSETAVSTTSVVPSLIPQDGEYNALAIVALSCGADGTITVFPTGFTGGQGQDSNVSGTASLDGTIGYGWQQIRPTDGVLSPTGWTHHSTARDILVWTVPPIPAGQFNTDAAADPLPSSLSGNLATNVLPNRSNPIADLMGIGLVPTSAIANGPFPTLSRTLTLPFPSTAITQVVPFPPAVPTQGVLMKVVQSQLRTLTTPTDWTLIRSEVYTSGRISVFWRYITGTETKPITLVQSGTASIIVQYRIYNDAHPTQLPEASGTVVAAATSIDCPSLTPSWGVANNVWDLSTGFGDDAATLISFPLADNQGTTELTGTSSLDCEYAFCSVNTRATVLDPVAQTWTTAQNAGTVLVAIPPLSFTVVDVSGIPLTALAAQAPDTFVGNITTGSAIPVAVPLADVDSVSVVYDATSHTFQRAALTGAITAAANSNDTAFGTLAADTFFGNFTAGIAVPAAVAGATVAGAGLTYTTGGILAVGAGTGLTVNANDVQISTIAAESFFINGTSGAAVPVAVAGSTVAGSGLTYTTGGILAVGAGTNVTVNANDIAVAAASDTVSGVLEIATQAEQETGTDVVRAVTPGRQQFHPSAAKFWVIATVSAGVPTIQASHNVTSITDAGTGILTVTIATDFSSANWVCGVSLETGAALSAAIQNRAVGSVQAVARDAAGTLTDPTAWHVWGYGDQ